MQALRPQSKNRYHLKDRFPNTVTNMEIRLLLYTLKGPKLTCAFNVIWP